MFLEKTGWQCSVFSLSGAVEVLSPLSWKMYHMPSMEYAEMTAWFSSPQWHRTLRRRIMVVAEEVEADLIVFDGVHPYLGLRAAIEALPVRSVWIRRGMWKPAVNSDLKSLSRTFDVIIEPGEFASAFDLGATRDLADKEVTNPIVIPEDERWSDETFAQEDERYCLVQLGAGVIGDTSRLQLSIAETLLRETDFVPMFIRNPLSNAENHDIEGARYVKPSFPLTPIYKRIDCAILACGYNSFHEAMNLGLPSIYIPNEMTKTDDQKARYDWAISKSLTPSRDSIRSNVQFRTFLTNLGDYRLRLKKFVGTATGASEAAEIIDKNFG